MAKAIVEKAMSIKVPIIKSENVREEIGNGISGEVDGKRYTIGKYKSEDGIAIQLLEEGKAVAVIHFEDKIKEDSL